MRTLYFTALYFTTRSCRIVFLLVALLVASSSFAQTTVVEYNEYGKPVDSTQGEFIVNRSVNLRAAPGTQSDVLIVLPQGKTVIVESALHGHYKITYKGKTGYSWHSFFSPK